MIEVQGLSKSFGKVKAVQNVSFSAANGQITGLLGPNGAGKSTTLRMLYTLLKPDSGTAKIDGFDIGTATMAVQSHIGVLSDAQGLYPAADNAREHPLLSGTCMGWKGSCSRDRSTA